MKILEINSNILKAKDKIEECDIEIKELLSTEEELYRFESEVNFHKMNL